jgi:phage terminase large subunit-like protein
MGGAMIKTTGFPLMTSFQAPSFIFLQSWDTANKSGERNDYSVCATWGVVSGKYYLLDVFRRRLDYPDLKRAVWEQAPRYDNRRF